MLGEIDLIFPHFFLKALALILKYLRILISYSICDQPYLIKLNLTRVP
jgi:hypothetical protein